MTGFVILVAVLIAAVVQVARVQRKLDRDGKWQFYDATYMRRYVGKTWQYRTMTDAEQAEWQSMSAW